MTTGSLDEGVAVEGTCTFKYRQSSLVATSRLVMLAYGLVICSPKPAWGHWFGCAVARTLPAGVVGATGGFQRRLPVRARVCEFDCVKKKQMELTDWRRGIRDAEEAGDTADEGEIRDECSLAELDGGGGTGDGLGWYANRAREEAGEQEKTGTHRKGYYKAEGRKG